MFQGNELTAVGRGEGDLMLRCVKNSEQQQNVYRPKVPLN